MKRRTVLAALAAAPLATVAPAAWSNIAPPELAAELPGARALGSGRLRYMGFHVYDARLWAAGPLADPLATPLALELEYARKLVGQLIAERSLDEMKRQGPIDDAAAARWLAAMKQAFPDVAAGHRITGVHRPGEAARFFHNGRFTGEVRDADFARRFFGIWLAPQTSQPALRESLLGQRA